MRIFKYSAGEAVPRPYICADQQVGAGHARTTPTNTMGAGGRPDHADQHHGARDARTAPTNTMGAGHARPTRAQS